MRPLNSRLNQPYLETETDQVRSNNEKHQVVVADYHAEVLTESADHRSDQVCAEERRWVRRLSEGGGEDEAGKKDRQGHDEKRPQQSFVET